MRESERTTESKIKRKRVMQTRDQVEITKTELKTTRRTPARRLLATSVESEFAVALYLRS